MDDLTISQLHARVGVMSRYRTPDDLELQAAKRALHAAVLGAHIERELRRGPELSRTQRAELARRITGPR
jgi:hypothetical protein